MDSNISTWPKFTTLKTTLVSEFMNTLNFAWQLHLKLQGRLEILVWKETKVLLVQVGVGVGVEEVTYLHRRIQSYPAGWRNHPRAAAVPHVSHRYFLTLTITRKISENSYNKYLSIYFLLPSSSKKFKKDFIHLKTAKYNFSSLTLIIDESLLFIPIYKGWIECIHPYTFYGNQFYRTRVLNPNITGWQSAGALNSLGWTCYPPTLTKSLLLYPISITKSESHTHPWQFSPLSHI